MPRTPRAQAAPSKALLRREALIDRLTDLILAQGFANASIDELARAMRCSKTTLYSIADTKERIILAAVRRFFARAAAEIDRHLESTAADPFERIREYLLAISRALTPASPEFFSSLDAWESTRTIYEENTRTAASRVRQLVDAAVPDREDAAFIGAVAGQTMESIHRGDIEAGTGLDDAAAYRYLADLIVRGLGVHPREGAA